MNKMAELGKAHAKVLMPSFGDDKEDQHKEITFLLKISEKQLQRLSAAGPSEDSNVRNNVQVGVLDVSRKNMSFRFSITF